MRPLMIILLLGMYQFGTAQQVRTTSEAFENRIDFLLSETVPFQYVSDLTEENIQEFVILDAREWEEYETSHITGARYIGYDQPSYTVVSDVSKDKKILLYCSIGYRSEKIGEELQKRGFTHVYNLYGSIFEWVNQGKPVVDINGTKTKYIHTYDRNWSKWMINKEYEKVW